MVEDPGWQPARVIYGWAIGGRPPHPAEPPIPHLQNETHPLRPASPPVSLRGPNNVRESDMKCGQTGERYLNARYYHNCLVLCVYISSPQLDARSWVIATMSRPFRYSPHSQDGTEHMAAA